MSDSGTDSKKRTAIKEAATAAAMETGPAAGIIGEKVADKLSPKKTYECKQCEQIFQSAEALNIHNEHVHNPHPQNNNNQNPKPETPSGSEPKHSEKPNSGDDSKLKNLRDGLKKSSSGEKPSSSGSGSKTEWGGGAAFLVGLAMLAHIIDIVTGFQRPGLIVPALYVVIIVFTLFSIFKFKLDVEETKLVGAAFIAYALPWVHQFFNDQVWKLVLSGIVFLFPIFVLYLMFKLPEDNGFHKLARWYVALWIIAITLWALANFSQGSGKPLIQSPWDGAKFFIGSITSGTSKFVQNSQKSLNAAIARATGQQYEGQEENERGIFLQNVKPHDQSYFVGSNIFVNGELRAKNIPGTIRVKNICLIPGVRQGKMTPMEIDLVSNDFQTISCDLGQATKSGSYEVKFISTFMYQTDATITYYFMNKNTYSVLDREHNGNVNSELGIPQQITAIYTGGPMELGLASTTMPIRLDPDTPNENKYPFGFSLVNKWLGGKLIRGYTYTLEVPDSISLTNCNRQHDEPVTADGRTTYKFNINNNNAKELFDSVTCWIRVEDYSMLVGTGIYSEQTFIAKAVYEYSVEQSTYILVQD